jgi:hypothetical protein
VEKVETVSSLLFQAEKADRRQSFASLALRKRYSYLTEPSMSEFPDTSTNLCRFLSEEETFFLYMLNSGVIWGENKQTKQKTKTRYPEPIAYREIS